MRTTRSAGVRRGVGVLGLVILGGLAMGGAARADDPPPASIPPANAPAAAPLPPTEPAAASGVVGRLSAEAAKLSSLVKTEAVRGFLDAVPKLPEPGKRTVYRDAERTRAYSRSEFDKLPEAEKEGLRPREFEPVFYYYTGYGSPLIYARPLDIVAEKAGWTGADGFKGKRVLDFGYGLIGHLRLLAMRGADVTGIEVEPVLRALYAEPGDTGEIEGVDGLKGTLRLLDGRWPADAKIAAAVKEGGPYDLIISKNTLKRGYIHPARKVDEKFLVKLGVENEVFVKAMRDALKPGGYAIIYNISPAQNPDDKPYLPHADGQCPFPRAMLEKAGFEVIEFDRPDHDAVLDVWAALGIDSGKSREELAKDLFAWSTVVRRKS